MTQLLNSQALESMADALLDGTMDVEEANAYCAIASVIADREATGTARLAPVVPDEMGNHLRSRYQGHADDCPAGDAERHSLPQHIVDGICTCTFAEDNPKKPCVCDQHPASRRLYLFSEGAAPLFGRDEDRDLAAGLKHYNSLVKDARRAWLRSSRTLEADLVRAYFELKQLAAYIEESCPARDHYVRCHTAVWNGLLRKHAEVPHDDRIHVHGVEHPKWGTMHAVPATKRVSVDPEGLCDPVEVITAKKSFTPANDKYRAEQDRWEDAERRRLAWPLVAFEPADADRGFLPDPTNIKSGSALAREYAAESSYTTTEFVREDGYVLVDDDGAKLERDVEVRTMGAVQWEYRRRKQMQAKGLTPQPYWMTSRQYAAVKDLERRMDRKRRLRKAARAQLIQLIERLGGDPRDPKVAEWVASNGIDNCLASLRRRAAQTEEVAA